VYISQEKFGYWHVINIHVPLKRPNITFTFLIIDWSKLNFAFNALYRMVRKGLIILKEKKVVPVNHNACGLSDD